MLRDKIKGTIIGVIIGTTLTGGAAIAASTTTLYDVVTNGIKIVVDGRQLNPTDANGNKVEPMIYNGTTYLPVRAVADALGKAVYWDGPNYTVYLGSMDGALEYPSVEFENMISIGTDPFTATGSSLKDNYGNTYSRAVQISSYGASYEYLMNMKYSRFKGTFYVLEGETSSNSTVLKIIADGKTIYTSPQMTKSSAPVDIDVNVTGYNDLKIEIADSGFYGLATGLADAGFYQ